MKRWRWSVGVVGVVGLALAALLVPAGAVAGTQTNGGLSTTAPDGATVKCGKTGTGAWKANGKLQTSFSLTVNSMPTGTNSVKITGNGVNAVLTAPGSVTVPANTAMPCQDSETYIFQGKSTSDGSGGNSSNTVSTSHQVSTSPTDCPSNETC